MPFRDLFYFNLIICLFFLPSAIGATSVRHADSVDSETQQLGRSSADYKLKPDELVLLSSIFDVGSGLVKSLFGPELGRALSNLMSDPKNNTEFASPLARMAGMLNETQLAKLKEANLEVSPEDCNAPRASRMVELKGVLAVLRNYLLKTKASGGCTRNELQGLSSALEKADLQVQEDNRFFNDQLELALLGNGPAKAELLKKYDLRVIHAFAEAQKKNGNTGLAQKIYEVFPN